MDTFVIIIVPHGPAASDGQGASLCIEFPSQIITTGAGKCFLRSVYPPILTISNTCRIIRLAEQACRIKSERTSGDVVGTRSADSPIDKAVGDGEATSIVDGGSATNGAALDRQRTRSNVGNCTIGCIIGVFNGTFVDGQGAIIDDGTLS